MNPESIISNQTEPAADLSNLRRYSFPLIIIASIITIYFQSLWFDFVSYDDYDLISNNEAFLSNPGNIVTAFTQHAFAGTTAKGVYYRPVLQASYILDYQIWKLNPFGFHLTNILLHIAASLLLFYLLKKLISNELFSLFGALLFALHPIQTEAVGWVAGRNDVLLGLFIAAMLLSYVHYMEDRKHRVIYFILSLLAFTLAIFTKEPAAFYILLLPLFELTTRRKETTPARIPYPLLRLLPFAVILLVYLAIRYSLFGEMVGAEQLYGTLPMFDRLVRMPAIAIQHLSLMIFPVNLSVIHQTESLFWFESLWSVVAVVLLLMYVVATALAWRFDKLLSLGMVWLMVGFLPLLNIIPLAVAILEHRLYVPLAAFALIMSRLFILLQTTSVSKYLMYIVGGILVVIASISFLRLPVWNNSETLWKDAIKKAPTATRAYFNLSGYYFDKQQYNEVIPLLEKYLELEPFDFIGYSKLRQTYFLAGKYEEAAGVCKKMIRFNPTNPARYIETAILYERTNQPDSAIAIYHQGLIVDSNSVQIHFNLARLYERLQRDAEAEYYYQATIRLNPSYAPAYYLAGRYYATKGKNELAIRMLETGTTLVLPSEEALALLKELYVKTKQEQRFTELLQRLNRR